MIKSVNQTRIIQTIKKNMIEEKRKILNFPFQLDVGASIYYVIENAKNEWFELHKISMHNVK